MPSPKARRRLAKVNGLLLVLACLTAPSAAADGGQSIAGATPIPFGQQQLGNTANGARTDSGCVTTYRSWWALSAVAGDRITVNWGSDQSPILHVFDVGVDDYTFANMDSFAIDFVNSNRKSQLVFRAPRTGTMPLSFVTKQGCNVYASEPGPYDFTAFVEHKLIPSIHVTKNKRHRTTFGMSVRNPDGVPIEGTPLSMDVQVVRKKRWVTLGTLDVDGEFWIRWGKSSHGKLQRVRVKVSGDGYLTATSGALKVRG